MPPIPESLEQTLARYRQQREAADDNLSDTIDWACIELKNKRKAVQDAARGEWDTLSLACRGLSLVSRSVGHYIVADQEWRELTFELRRAVEYFADLKFSGETPPNISMPFVSSTVWKQTLVSEAGLTTVMPYFHKHMKTIPDFGHYLVSKDHRPDIIQTFVWRVLVGEVFNRFQWAGAARRPMVDLCTILLPEIEGVQPDPDKRLKTHTWRRFTSDHIVDSFSRSPKEVQEFDQLVAVQYLIDRITEVIAPFESDRKGWRHFDLIELLRSLLEVAISLDRKMCTQLSWMEWQVPSAREGHLVVHPALVRRGMRDGTSLEGETVVCEHVISDDPLHPPRTEGGPVPGRTVRFAPEPSRNPGAPTYTPRVSPLLHRRTEEVKAPPLRGLGITLPAYAPGTDVVWPSLTIDESPL